MIENPFKKGMHTSRFGRALSGMTAGLMAATSIIGTNTSLLTKADGEKIDLGTFTYATADDLGSANKYAAFGKTYYQENHMEGIFACENFHPSGDAFGTTTNVQNYIDMGENYIYIGNAIGSGIDGASDEIEMAKQTNGVSSVYRWDIIIPDTVEVLTGKQYNNGNGFCLRDTKSKKLGVVFNSREDLANNIYHVGEVTYNIDFDKALKDLNDNFQNYWKNVDTSDVTVVTTNDTGDQNNWSMDIACAEGGNVITLTSEQIKTHALNIHGQDGVEDYSLIINVTNLTDGDTFMKNIRIDDDEAGYGPQAQKLLFNMLPENQGETYTFGQTDQGVILAPLSEIDIKDGSHNGSVMAHIVDNINCQIHQNPFRQLPVGGEKKANVVISKMAVTGNSELPGAKLTLTNADISSNDWNAIIEATIKANDDIDFSKATDATGTVIGITWISGETPATISGLPDMEGYALTETSNDGEPVFIAGNDKEYKVIDSTLSFDISDNVVTNAVASSKGSDEKGYYDTSAADDNKITVCDAERYHADVTFEKTDISGDALPGARMKLSAKNVVLTEAVLPENADSSFSISQGTIIWTSSRSGFTFRDLPDGNYTYEEIDAPSPEYTAPNGTEITFTVKDGRVYDADQKLKVPATFEIINENGNATKAGDIIVSKKSITGGDEVGGAKLTLTNPDISSDKWDSIYTNTREYDRNNATSAHSFQKVVKNNKTIGLTWESNDEYNAVIKGLPVGKAGYSLKEESANGALVQDKYTVIPSELKFEIDDDGKVIVDENADNTAPTEQPANGDGYFELDGKKVTVWDAEATDLIINKTDVTGEKEIAGAKLTLTSSNADWSNVTVDDNSVEIKAVTASGKQNGIQWTSSDTKTLNIKGLTNGTYTLKETGADSDGVVILGGEEYKVIPSSVTFTVENGKIKNVKMGGKAAATKADATSKNSYVINASNNNTNKITVCDAEKYPKTDISINKTDITGETEVVGAKLTLTNPDLNTIQWEKVTVGDAASDIRFNVVKNGKGEQIGVSWNSTDRPAVIKNLIEKGTYTLKEESSDADSEIISNGKIYTIIPSEVQFQIVDGKPTATSSSKAPTKADEKGNGYYKFNNDTITVCDAERTDVILDKTDVTGEAEVKGATITITSDDKDIDWARIRSLNADNTRLNWTDNSVSWESDGDNVVIAGLENGTYILTETATDGKKITDDQSNEYDVIDTEYTFTVKNGKVTVTDAETAFDSNSIEGYVVADDNAITMCDAIRNLDNTEVLISKSDITGEKELKGAKLTIFAEDGKTVVIKEWTSNGKTAKKVSLPNGNYVLRETGGEFTADGKTYKVITSDVTFTVENGVVTARGTKTTADKNAEDSYALFDGKNKITICDAERIPVVLNKTDVTGENEIEGAKITITSKDGKQEYSWTSVIGETKQFYLDDGDYVLREEAAAGSKVVDENGNEYEVIESETAFTVKGGMVTSAGAKTEFDSKATEGYVVTNGNEITVCDAKRTSNTTDITLSKTDVTGEKEVTGAKITITDSDDKTVDTWVSDGKDHVIKGLADGTYTLTETSDDGKKIVDEDGNEYDVIDSAITFTVKDGKVTVTGAKEVFDKSATEGYVVSDENKITICDAEKVGGPKTKVTLNKTDVTGEEELAGATLTIKDKDGKVVDSWTSEIGKTKTFELENGEYELIETGDKITDKDGNEYEVIDSSLKFKVEDGKVIVTEGKTELDTDKGYYDFDEASNIIRVSDAKKASKTKVTLNKTDVTGEEELAGATLTIKSSDGNIELSWVSVIGETKEFELENGEYELIETGDKITDKDGNEYEVIDSSLKFKVEDGKITIVEGKTELDTDKGYYDFDEASNIIRVSDAKKARKIDNDDSERDQDTTGDEDNTSKPDESSTNPDNPEDSSRNPVYDDSSRPTDDDETSRTPVIDESSRDGDTIEDSSKPDESSDADSSKATPVKDSSQKDSSGKDNSSKAATTTTTTAKTTTATNSNPGTGAKVVINSVEFLAAAALCFAALSRKKKDDDDEDDR